MNVVMVHAPMPIGANRHILGGTFRWAASDPLDELLDRPSDAPPDDDQPADDADEQGDAATDVTTDDPDEHMLPQSVFRQGGG